MSDTTDQDCMSNVKNEGGSYKSSHERENTSQIVNNNDITSDETKKPLVETNPHLKSTPVPNMMEQEWMKIQQENDDYKSRIVVLMKQQFSHLCRLDWSETMVKIFSLSLFRLLTEYGKEFSIPFHKNSHHKFLVIENVIQGATKESLSEAEAYCNALWTDATYSQYWSPVVGNVGPNNVEMNDKRLMFPIPTQLRNGHNGKNDILVSFPEMNSYGSSKKILPPSLFDVVDGLIEGMFPEHATDNKTILYSRKNCPQQRLHTDYESTANKPSFYFSHRPLVFSWIYSFQEGTKVIVPTVNDQCCKIQDEIHIPPNSLMIWRGDLPHAGGSYNMDHFRLHGFVDHEESLIQRNKDTIYFSTSAIASAIPNTPSKRLKKLPLATTYSPKDRKSKIDQPVAEIDSIKNDDHDGGPPEEKVARDLPPPDADAAPTGRRGGARKGKQKRS